MFFVATIALMCGLAQAVLAAPTITKVTIAGTDSARSLTITGTGFGSKPSGVPCNECVSKDLSILNGAADQSWGFTDEGDINYLSWTNTEIKVTGFTGDPGDQIVVALWNPQTRQGATWGGNIPSEFSAPQIKSVAFADIGKDLHITVKGTGFGAAPPGVPGLGANSYFQFCDYRIAKNSSQPTLFCAGYEGGSQLEVNYVSWTNTEIVIQGFNPQYGQQGWTVKVGDAVTLRLYYTGDEYHGLTGVPQTAWGGRLP